MIILNIRNNLIANINVHFTNEKEHIAMPYCEKLKIKQDWKQVPLFFLILRYILIKKLTYCF